MWDYGCEAVCEASGIDWGDLQMCEGSEHLEFFSNYFKHETDKWDDVWFAREHYMLPEDTIGSAILVENRRRNHRIIALLLAAELWEEVYEK